MTVAAIVIGFGVVVLKKMKLVLQWVTVLIISKIITRSTSLGKTIFEESVGVIIATAELTGAKRRMIVVDLGSNFITTVIGIQAEMESTVTAARVVRK